MSSPATARQAEVRLEIQVLRAVAVVAVVLYHLWPNRVPGGFVGVDVFFAISGFLITGHLLRDIDRQGRVPLGRFWSARARRLIPASLTTVLVTTIAVLLIVPQTRWAQFMQEFIASTFYVENWTLSANAVDYSAQTNRPSPVQHFWSLSTEEQFYIVWPLLFLVALLIARRRLQAHRRVLFAVLSVVVAGSLIASIVTTTADGAAAYFSTFTRAWEFGLGGLIAFAPPPSRLPSALRTVLSWIGYAAIGAALVLYSDTTPFPSYTALLPVLGTLAVIVAGMPANAYAITPSIAGRFPPVRFVGDVSYGVYLWHWPLVVLVPFATHAPLIGVQKAAILGGSLLLGWLSKTVIEDPIRTRSVFVRRRPRWTLLATLVAMLLVATPSAIALGSVSRPGGFIIGADQPCAGAAAVVDDSCADRSPSRPLSELADFAFDLPVSPYIDCTSGLDVGIAPGHCRLADPPSPTARVALIGDSHAVRLFEPVTKVAQKQGWRLDVYSQTGCPLIADRPMLALWGSPQSQVVQCADNSTALVDELVAEHDLDAVIVTNRTRLYSPGDDTVAGLSAADVEPAFQKLLAAGIRVIVAKDAPGTEALPTQYGEGAPDCQIRLGVDAEACRMPFSAVRDYADPMVEAANATGASVLDLDDVYCDSTWCHPYLGGMVVYSDSNHLSRSFALTLVPTLNTRLGELVPART
ncbi:acyltransferase family protein [Schumannella soli]|uniref:acyltransferase family protein n=1 Tax=Schumannella soli TaxID=2590779 RepID=UPI001C6415E1|nr:acyltransferase family protein [Schumannella soli]